MSFRKDENSKKILIIVLEVRMISRLTRRVRMPQMIIKAKASNWGDVDKIHPILVTFFLINMYLGMHI